MFIQSCTDVCTVLCTVNHCISRYLSIISVVLYKPVELCIALGLFAEVVLQLNLCPTLRNALSMMMVHFKCTTNNPRA